MKKLGLIGGMGYESTLIYYKQANRLINSISQGKAFPEMAIESVDLMKLLALVSSKQYSPLEEYLWQRMESLLKSGCSVVALTSVTSHIVYQGLESRMQKYPNATLAGIPEVACIEAKRLGCKRALLLGTLFTMTGDFFKGEFQKHGIEVVVPDTRGIHDVHRIIAGELELGIVKPDSQKTLIDIVEAAKKHQGAQAVILGCTELPLALSNSNSPLQCLDVMDLHIKRLVELCASSSLSDHPQSLIAK